MAKLCLNLICPSAVEEKLLDALLESDEIELFTSAAVHSHGISSARLTAQEQVLGRSRSSHIQVLATEQAMARLIARIGKEFAGTQTRYWATPVAFDGETS